MIFLSLSSQNDASAVVGADEAAISRCERRFVVTPDARASVCMRRRIENGCTRGGVVSPRIDWPPYAEASRITIAIGLRMGPR